MLSMGRALCHKWIINHVAVFDSGFPYGKPLKIYATARKVVMFRFS